MHQNKLRMNLNGIDHLTSQKCGAGRDDFLSIAVYIIYHVVRAYALDYIRTTVPQYDIKHIKKKK